jgi:hypothetical protein
MPIRGSRLILAPALLVSFLAGCSGIGRSGPGSSAPAAQAPIAERFRVDGTAVLSSVGAVHQQKLDIIDDFGTGSKVRASTLAWSVQNDDRNCFFAMEWDDPTQDSFDPAGTMDDFDGVAIVFDSGGSGHLAENADAHRLVMTNYGSIYGDLHVSGTDMADDAIGDGMGKMLYLPGEKKYHAEFLIPVAPDAGGEDGTLSGATRFNILIYDHIQLLLAAPAGNIGELCGTYLPAAGTDTSSWQALPFTTTGAYDQPSLPAGLTGLIAFISDHENPKGELYTFDPSNGLVSRITNNTGLYMDGASLSHDRTRIAFYGSSGKTDYQHYEIYTVNIQGTDHGPKPITSNSILDGHPAWSPDDTKIVYASFQSGGIASLILTDSDGSGTRLDLTRSAGNDNDPDWLPDGRIVFKTDRFDPATPHVHIALMDADGTKVLQLTGATGAADTSDHDPTATESAVLFERFMSGTDYSTDPAAEFKPWDIVEVGTDGSGERTLVSDGWINWLPIHDPSGKYILYLKTVGYTDARLMDNEGRDLGRLIPGLTKIRYIDWK